MRVGAVTFLPLRKVPLVEPRSVTSTVPSARMRTRACFRLMSLSVESGWPSASSRAEHQAARRYRQLAICSRYRQQSLGL